MNLPDTMTPAIDDALGMMKRNDPALDRCRDDGQRR